MEFIVEVLFEIIIESIIEFGTSKNIPKIIRYPLVLFIILFFMAVVGGIFVLGIMLLEKSILGGLLIICLSLFLLAGSITYIKKNIFRR